MPRFVPGILLLLASPVFCALPVSAWAKGTGGTDISPVMSGGVTLYTGITGKSITGANGYFLNLRAEKRKATLRPHVAANFEYSAGTASIGTDTPAYTLFGAGFLAGLHLFLFTEGRFQPYLGGSGVMAWNYFKMGAPPPGIEPNTEGISFGYEANAGVDLRLGSVDGNALRLQGTYWAVTSKLAGVSGFQLTGFKFSIGIVY